LVGELSIKKFLVVSSPAGSDKKRMSRIEKPKWRVLYPVWINIRNRDKKESKTERKKTKQKNAQKNFKRVEALLTENDLVFLHHKWDKEGLPYKTIDIKQIT